MTIELDRFLRRAQRGFALTQPRKTIRQVVEARGQNGREGIGSLCGELTIELDRFLRRAQRRFALTQIRKTIRQVVEARGQSGCEGIGPLCGEVAA